MSEKSEKSPNKGRGMKILNDGKTPVTILSTAPLPAQMQITMSLMDKKPTTRKKDKNMDHYVLQTVKKEGTTEGFVGETIDFILTEDNAEETKGRPSATDKEMHPSEDDDEGDDNSAEDMKTEEIIEHVCGKCFKTFRRFRGLKKHIDFCRYDSGYEDRKAEMLKNVEKIEKDAVVMENKDICFCCGESYDTFHLGHINCPDCPKSFKSQSSYERHIFITHSEYNDYPCTICNAKLRSENLLKLHIDQHRNRGKPYACKICGKDFTRSYHLKRHQKYSSCSPDQNDAMHCKVCNKVFFRLDNLRCHLKQHLGTHTTKKSEYMCPICKNCFYSLSTLNIHTRTHTGERPFDCDLCDKKFPSLVALKKHRRYHTGEKPYLCAICNQSFAVKEVLNRHMKRHTGERPHVCRECKKSFIQATQLRNHLKTHLRPFECDECKTKFKTQKQLERHQKTHVPKSRKCSSTYSCSICDVDFRNKFTLMVHLESRKHIKAMEKNNTPTNCGICEKNFDTVMNLEFHILKEHEVDPEGYIREKSRKEQAEQVTSSTATKPNLTKANVGDDDNDVVDKEENKVASVNAANSDNNDLEEEVVQEFIVTEFPLTSNAKESVLFEEGAFTVIPLDAPIIIEKIRSTPVEEAKIESQKTLGESLAEAIADDVEMQSNDGNESDNEDDDNATKEENERIKENVGKLINMLVDKVTLKTLGWPGVSVENIVCSVIKNCGYNLTKDSENMKDWDYATRMREYVKLFFTVVIHNDSIKELLNNYTVDNVIEYVLTSGKDVDDDDDDDDNKANDNNDGDGDDDDDDADADGGGQNRVEKAYARGKEKCDQRRKFLKNKA